MLWTPNSVGNSKMTEEFEWMIPAFNCLMIHQQSSYEFVFPLSYLCISQIFQIPYLVAALVAVSELESWAC